MPKLSKQVSSDGLPSPVSNAGDAQEQGGNEDDAQLIPQETLDLLVLLDAVPSVYPRPPTPPPDPQYRIYYGPPSLCIRMTTISDNAYKIPALKGRENYPVWKVQMRDMYEETGLWGFINNTEITPVISAGSTTPSTPAVTQADIDGWLKKKRQALGLLRRRIESGPMVHVATATEPHIAWNTLARMYEQVGTSAMTLLRQKFYGNRMAESDDLEEHIKTMRRLHDEINLSVSTAGGNQITEVEWIEQLVASLPESYDMMVSMIDFTFSSTADPNGIEMSQKIQTRLLNEANRRKTRASNGQSAFYTVNSRRDSKGRFLPENKRAIDRTKLVCHNCGKNGHKRTECRKPGGGAYHERKKSKKPRYDGKHRKDKGESANIAQSSTSATGATAVCEMACTPKFHALSAPRTLLPDRPRATVPRDAPQTNCLISSTTRTSVASPARPSSLSLAHSVFKQCTRELQFMA
ncbi:gag-polypeptide of LTR copia-type [Ceratobasidium sp. AG-Ba]|nr:gag-polypeptide of LTR copia-type [Ceratobasidium sp. AG-Ba]